VDDPVELRELFAAFGPVTVRHMFGGSGIYADGVMFALVSDGDIYLKADDATIPTLLAEGSKPFVYSAKGKGVTLSYWRLPDRLLDDPDEFARFARAALASAQRAADKKRAPRRPAAPRRRRARSRR
jgi:DNA transformation protein